MKKIIIALMLIPMLVGAQEKELPPYPKSMGALGDSLTRAANAGLRRQRSIFPWITVNFFWRSYLRTVRDRNGSYDRPIYSWTTGSSKKVLSHRKRLEKMSGKKIKFHNSGITGAKIGLVWQKELPELKKWSQDNLGKNYPDYVTLMIGANDLCTGSADTITEPEKFEEHLDKILEELLINSNDTKVLVSAFPNVNLLPEILFDSKWGARKTCADLWKKFPICPAITRAKNEEQLNKVQEYYDRYHDIIESKIADLRLIYGDRIRYASKIQEESFTEDDIAVDCFHPNYNGQKKLARKSFESTWWAD